MDFFVGNRTAFSPIWMGPFFTDGSWGENDGGIMVVLSGYGCGVMGAAWQFVEDWRVF
jgi:hypothetical protein